MKRKIAVICCICSVLCPLLSAQNDLLRGFDAFSRSDWQQAIFSFENALTSMPSEQHEALYWLIMAQASAQNYQHAIDYADRFLAAYQFDERAAEVLYQKGRIFHVCGNYKQSSDILYRFIKDYPLHPKVPSAYYWIGENLYALGAHPEARTVFTGLIVNYPESGKVNEARYKIVQIDQQSVQAELLALFEEVKVGNTEPSADIPATAADVSDLPEETSGEAEPEVPAAEEVLSAAESVPDSRIDELADQLNEERKKNDELHDRLISLEEKIDALSTLLSQMSSEQEAFLIQQQQEKDIAAQQRVQAVQQEREKRKKELKDLRQRARVLEKLYEQRTQGAQ